MTYIKALVEVDVLVPENLRLIADDVRKEVETNPEFFGEESKLFTLSFADVCDRLALELEKDAARLVLKDEQK